jgi:CBS domain containing-hemolysin-like protein
MTKALSDDWMGDHGFVDGNVVVEKNFETWWAKKPINSPLTITENIRCKDAIAHLKREGFDMVPVLSEGTVSGVVTEGT